MDKVEPESIIVNESSMEEIYQEAFRKIIFFNDPGGLIEVNLMNT